MEYKGTQLCQVQPGIISSNPCVKDSQASSEQTFDEAFVSRAAGLHKSKPLFQEWSGINKASLCVNDSQASQQQIVLSKNSRVS